MIKLITHTDLDGVGCAILAKYVYGDNVDITFADIYSVNDIMEKLDYTKYESVFMTDLSCDLDYISKLDKLIDHHKTALYLNKYDNCKVEVVRKNGVLTCGTSMFADYLEVKHNFMFDVDMCEFITLVQNYDTWEWTKNGMTKANDLNTLFYAMGRYKFIEHVLNCHTIFNETANIIIDCKNREQENYINEKLKTMEKIEFDDKVYGFVFAEQYFSELGNKMKEHGCDVAIMINMSDMTVSFRTVDGKDASEIARCFDNGGGHKNASGAKLYWLKYIKNDIFNNFIERL